MDYLELINSKKVFNENCFDTMSKLPKNCIDLIITSPPYNKAGHEGFIRKRHSGDTWKSRNIDYGDISENDFIDEDIYKKQQIDLINEMCRILKDDGSIFYNHKIRISNHKASHPIEWILKSNAIFRQQLIWDRGSGPAVAPIRYVPSTELIFWLTKNASQPNFERDKNALFLGEVWRFPAKSNPHHPAPFPEELPKNIIMCIKNKNSNIVVYDPYAGTGTSLKVAKWHGFKYFGSEIQKKYCDIANNNLSNTLF
jgi:modification methylase